MSLESALVISMSGLRAASTQLELTASNISNASVDGYTRKTTTVQSATLGSIGGGTEVVGFTRAENAALFTTLTESTSNAGLRDKQDLYLQQVQDLLGTSTGDNPRLSQYVTSFVNSWTQLAATPESLVNKRQVVQDGVNLADEVRRLSNSVESLDRTCNTEINSTLTDMNSYLVQIQDLNQKISQALNSKLSTGDLVDKRDTLILKVSEMTGVTVLQRDFGQIALYTSTGYQLVDGASARVFSYDGTNISATTTPGLSLNTALVGGSIEALVNFRATTSPASTDPATSIIQKLRDQLDLMVTAFTSTVTTATSGELTFAQAYNSATTGAGELAAHFFSGTNRTDFGVNTALLDGSAEVKTAAAGGVTDALLDSTRTYSADGLNVSSVSYMTLVTSSFTTFQQAATNIGTLKDTAESTRDYLKEKLANETAVNVDNELVNLVTFQNAYSASAHAMSVIKDLFIKLENLL